MTEKKAVKQPQDHKPKKDGAEEHEVTVRGVKLVVRQRDLDDYRVVRSMARARRGDGFSSIDVLDIILGDEQHDRIVAAIAAEDGHVDQETMGSVVQEIFEALSPNS